MTLKQRRERNLYVSLWFYIASIVGFAILHVVGNLVVPLSLFKSVPVYAGVQDALLQAWYSHGVITYFLTMPFMGLMYYFLPKAADRPVFSYKLCIVHFWSFVFIGIWAGPYQLNYTSVATWVSSLGLVFSLMLLMPSWAGVVNGLSTLRGAWNRVGSEPVLVLRRNTRIGPTPAFNWEHLVGSALWCLGCCIGCCPKCFKPNFPVQALLHFIFGSQLRGSCCTSFQLTSLASLKVPCGLNSMPMATSLTQTLLKQ